MIAKSLDSPKTSIPAMLWRNPGCRMKSEVLGVTKWAARVGRGERAVWISSGGCLLLMLLLSLRKKN